MQRENNSIKRTDVMNDTRLTNSELEAAVDFAYGGAAQREGRKAQARTLSSIFKSKGSTSEKSKVPVGKI